MVNGKDIVIVFTNHMLQGTWFIYRNSGEIVNGSIQLERVFVKNVERNDMIPFYLVDDKPYFIIDIPGYEAPDDHILSFDMFTGNVVAIDVTDTKRKFAFWRDLLSTYRIRIDY